MEWTSSKEQGEQSFLEMWDRNTKGRQLLLLLCLQGWWLLLRMGRGNFVDQVLGVNMQNHHLWVVETHVPLCLGLCQLVLPSDLVPAAHPLVLEPRDKA